MPKASNSAPRARRSAKTILIAGGEDHKRVVSLALDSIGYHQLFAGNGEEAIRKASEFQGPIQLLLTGMEMDDMTGVALAQRLKRERPETKVFILSGLNSGMLVLDQGWQFLPTPFESEMLRVRIRNILGQPQPSVGTGSETPDGLSRLERLTQREIQVLRLVAGGNSTKQVAAILGIAFKTAVGHRSRLMHKLSIHDSATLVRYAVRAGLIDP